MIERSNNTNVALEKLFEEFYNMIAEARGVPFTEKIMLDESDLVNLVEDLKRRDFTINAMAYNEEHGLVDVFDGMGDLQKGIIRCRKITENGRICRTQRE